MCFFLYFLESSSVWGSLGLSVGGYGNGQRERERERERERSEQIYDLFVLDTGLLPRPECQGQFFKRVVKFQIPGRGYGMRMAAIEASGEAPHLEP